MDKWGFFFRDAGARPEEETGFCYIRALSCSRALFVTATRFLSAARFLLQPRASLQPRALPFGQATYGQATKRALPYSRAQNLAGGLWRNQKAGGGKQKKKQKTFFVCRAKKQKSYFVGLLFFFLRSPGFFSIYCLALGAGIARGRRKSDARLEDAPQVVS